MMIRFPYKKELSSAYLVTLKNPWLWVFGLFLGGAAGNFSGQSGFDPVNPKWEISNSDAALAEATSWISGHLAEFISFLLLVFSVLLILVVLQGLSKGAVIWTAAEFAKTEDKRNPAGVTFKEAAGAGKIFFNRIIGLQISLFLSAVGLVVITAVPIFFLFAIGAAAKATILLLLAMSLFLPVIIVISFGFIFGPIFIVIYKQSIPKAFMLSLKLVRKRLWQCLGAVIVILGIGIAVAAAGAAIFYLVSLIGVGLSLFAASTPAGADIAVMILFFGSSLIGAICVIVLESAYASFSQAFWAIMVKSMMGELELDEKEQAFATEPVT